jgi:hypothetical protein
MTLRDLSYNRRTPRPGLVYVRSMPIEIGIRRIDNGVSRVFVVAHP